MNYRRLLIPLTLLMLVLGMSVFNNQVNAQPVTLRINFQNPSAPVPAGYIRDFGEGFGPRTGANQGSGLVYGWIVPGTTDPLDLATVGTIPGNGRDRNFAGLEQRLDTFMHMQADDITGAFDGVKAEGWWEIAVPPGAYTVTVSVGDATATNSIHRINVEGVNAINNFVPSGANGSAARFREATVVVNVADERLTITSAGGTNTKINYIIIESNLNPSQPLVLGANPGNGQSNVFINSSISTTSLYLPNGGVDEATVTTSSVYLYPTAGNPVTDRVPVSSVNTTGGGDAITLTPATYLAAFTNYTFVITNAVRDVSGAAFAQYTSTFTTNDQGGATPSTIAFTKVDTAVAPRGYTSVVMGPDNDLYAATNSGQIYHWDVDAVTGALTNERVINLLGGRAIIGLAFQPGSTATSPTLWVSHNYGGLSAGPHFSGAIARLRGTNVGGGSESWTRQDVIVGLPRSVKDHLTNSIAFGPDGALYFPQGSISAMGERDDAWGNEPETILSSAVLRLDINSLPGTLPLDVSTGTPEASGDLLDENNYELGEAGLPYDPLAPGAVLTLYATGVRNAYDLVWHTNGQLYVPTNGSAGGGNVPATPPTLPISCQNRIDRATNGDYTGPVVPAVASPVTQPDYLFRVVQGGYYGHPNPTRCEWVMNGGNPTGGADPGQVGNHYPIGTLPDRNWRGFAYDFGLNKSANGVIEYRNPFAFGGALQGRLLVVRYSQNDDIIVLTPGGPSLNIIAEITGITGFLGFNNPLDLIEDVDTGNLYVVEYGNGMNGRITMLRPNQILIPNITVAPASLTYTDTVGGGASAPQNVTITNTGTANLVIQTPTLGGANADQFQISAPPSTLTIAPSASVTVGIVFNPTTTGPKSATLTINSNDPDTPAAQVTLTGTATAAPVPNIQVSTTAVNYPDTLINTTSPQQTVTITNSGTADLIINPTPNLGGVNANQFQITGAPGLLTIPAGSSVTVGVSFAPTTTGGKTAVLAIASNDPDQPTTNIALNGQATSSAAGPNIVVSPSRLIFSDPVTPSTASPPKTITITNTGTTSLVISPTPNITGAQASQFIITQAPSSLTIAPGASVTMQVALNATSNGVKVAQVNINSNDPDTPVATVELRGVGFTNATGGSNEPSLQRILDTFAIPVTVGDNNPANTTIHDTLGTAPLLGQEVSIQSFRRANNTQPVTFEVLAAFANNTNPVTRVGWYTTGNRFATNEVFTVNQNSHQMLLPATSGSLSFVPTGNFGFYSVWPPFSNRHVYSEDILNTWAGATNHKVRVYPLRDASGVVPNAYIIGFEEFTSGNDYNDVVMIVRNVEPAPASAGGNIVLENRDWVTLNGQNIPQLSYLNRWLTFQQIVVATPNNGGTISFHNEVVLRIYNTDPTTNLQVTGLTISDLTEFSLPNGEAPTSGVPINIAPNGFYDLTVRCIETVGVNASNRIRTLTINSSDPDEPVANVTLACGWMPRDEANSELPAPQVGQAFGFQLNLGFPFDSAYVARGDEVLSPDWRRADSSKPVYVRQLAAYHGCCVQTASFQINGPGGGQFTHHPNFGQSLLPSRLDSANPANLTLPAEMLINPTGNPFQIIAAGYNSNRGANGQTHAVRFWPVRNNSGELVPNAYYVIQDYINTACGAGSQNCDFNDNVYLVTNIEPAVTQTDVTVTLAESADPTPANQNFNYTMTARNLSTFTAQGVTAAFTTPAGFSIVNVTPPSGVGCSTTGQVVSCSIGLLAGSEQRAITITVRPSATGVYTATAQVTTTSTETNTTNNTASIDTTVTDPGNLPSSITVVKQASPEGAQVFQFNTTGAGLSNFTLVDDGTVGQPLSVRVNFQSETAPVPSGYFRDWGQAFGLRTGASQGTNQSYGWVLESDLTTPLNLVGNGRDRNRTGIEQRLDTIVHMQLVMGTGITTPGAWEYAVPNGTYTVTVSVGDAPGSGGVYDSQHSINVEGTQVLTRWQASAVQEYNAQTTTVTVTDGRLTIHARGGTNTKINYVEINSVAAATNSRTFSNLSPGTYTITEIVPAGWALTGATCDAAGTPIQNGVSVTLSGAQNVTCTFNNIQASTPAIDIQKTPDTQTIASGETANFSVTVANTGNVTLTNVVITDPLTPGCARTFASLAVNESQTYTCAQPNVTASFVNTINVTATPPTGPALTDSDTANVVVSAAAVQVVKVPDSQTVPVGGTASFTITVTNPGTVALTSVVLNDPQCSPNPLPLAGGDTNSNGQLEPTETWTYNCAIPNVTGDFTNTATVTANPPVGQPVTDTDTAQVFVAAAPAVDIQKTPDSQTVASGDTATFSITVTNPGTVALTSVVVNDPQCGPNPLTLGGGDTNGNGQLEPGETWTYSCSVTNVTASFTNTATVTAQAGATPVTDTDTANVIVGVSGASIQIAKTPDTQTVTPGSSVQFTITVTNNGTENLTNVVVLDPLAPVCNSTIGALNATQVQTYTCTVTNVTASFTNIALVSGQTTGGQTVTDDDSADVIVSTTTASIDIQKTPDTQTVTTGGTASFTITVTNTGTEALTGVAVTDALTPTCNTTIGALAAGATQTITCAATNVTATFTNTAVVNGATAGGQAVTDSDDAVVTVNATAQPGISITKAADQTILPNGTATFTITVTNTGNVDLTVGVDDPLTPDCTRSLGILTAGASQSYTCSLINVAATFTATATVTGITVDAATVTANDSAVVTVNATPTPSILILKSPDQTILTGAAANFTITVFNNGNVDLTNVTVTDALTPTCDNVIGSLAAGTIQTYTCSLANVTADFVNTASVSATDPGGATLLDSDDAIVTVSNTATPSIDIQVTPATQQVPQFALASFTVTVTINGNVPLDNVFVTAGDAACNLSLGNMIAGQSYTYTCSAPIPAAMAMPFSVSGLYAAGGATASDAASVDVTVIPVDNSGTNPGGNPGTNNPSVAGQSSTFSAFDPFITKIAEPPFGLPGENVTFTLVVTNPGTTPAADVVVIDPIPAQVEILSATAPTGTITVTGQDVRFSIATLQPGETITITIETRVRADVTVPFVIVNEACIQTSTMSARCASASVISVTALPSTGETPFWVTILRGLLYVALAAVTVGGGWMTRARMLRRHEARASSGRSH
jgi:uncharacterized repeat protein (TIGR01451 family)